MDQWTPEKPVNAIDNFNEFYYMESISVKDRINDKISSKFGGIPTGVAQNAHP
ncbi:hypothetical protein [Microbulbifer sp. JTAC008]|uniref:hypothetical protein n=1 Tax=unclassified Microbulbifer TaxID=2619833 RepID=UPI002B30704B|nr:hypothetical protein QT397_16555 [Microbulbifer sp. MKSA007]